MWEEDQRVSQPVAMAARQDPRLRRRFLFELDESDWPAGYSACRDVAHRNVERLDEIVRAHGWPTPSRAGIDAATAAWGIAQHADDDNDVRRRFLPLLHAAVAEGEPVGEHLAALADRITLADGTPQLYGTLVQDDGDDWVLRPPVDDIERLDERRAAIGLRPWRDWVSTFPPPSTLYGQA